MDSFGNIALEAVYTVILCNSTLGNFLGQFFSYFLILLNCQLPPCRGPAAAQVSSILFPGMRVAINSSKTRRQQILDPLVKQQIEWNVKQEAGTKKYEYTGTNVELWINTVVQGGPSGRGQPFVDIEIRVAL